MVSDNTDIGDGLFKVSKDGMDRGPSPAEMAEEGPGAAEEARLVSVLTLHLGRLAIAQVAADRGSALLLDTSTLSTSLATDQDYQQFQFRFGQSGKTWSESILTAPDQSVFKMRLESEPPQQPAQALASLPPDLDISR